MTDIVERARKRCLSSNDPLWGEVADEIERLQVLFDKWHTIAAEQHADIERLRIENKLLAGALGKLASETSDEIERLEAENKRLERRVNQLSVDAARAALGVKR